MVDKRGKNKCNECGQFCQWSALTVQEGDTDENGQYETWCICDLCLPTPETED